MFTFINRPQNIVSLNQFCYFAIHLFAHSLIHSLHKCSFPSLNFRLKAASGFTKAAAILALPKPRF